MNTRETPASWKYSAFRLRPGGDAALKPVPEGHRPMSRQALADRIIEDRLPVRFQLQMHKYVWSPDARGV